MSKTTKARVFVPLTKVDEEQRLVYGRITQEVLDKSGEVMDYETSKPHFQKWSDDISERTGGLSKGNLRVMHGLNVAGKLTDISFDDEAKAIDVCAKVVDDAEWEKVTEGCYTGFSVGGKYVKRWNDTVDGATVKKYTAGPGEVSLVDDPCVPEATFSLVKSDGAVMQKMFKVAGETTEEPAAPVEPVAEEPAAEETVAETQGEFNFTNDDVVNTATEIAKAANDGTSWMDHVGAARDQLIKAAGGKVDAEAVTEDNVADQGPEDKEADASASDEAANKVTPAGVKQVWTSSDGKTFEKKADAETHELTLQKAAEPTTDADKLAARLNKALTPEPAPEPEPGLWEDFDRLSKVVAAISTPFVDGAPKLEKGMYTVNRFSHVLSDVASLARSIKGEGTTEGDDAGDSTVVADLKGSLTALCASFLDYTKEQVTELLAGIDDEVCVSYYDYYYNVAHTDGEDQLAKDVCSAITELRDPSREKREELSKLFVAEDDTVEVSDELSPALQKRFSEIETDRDSFRKIAETAVEKVEELSKRMQTLEDTPLPRAPNPANLALREGDGQFFGKTVTNDQERVEVLQNMLQTHGADGLATMMIKAAHATGGQKLSLKS